MMRNGAGLSIALLLFASCCASQRRSLPPDWDLVPSTVRHTVFSRSVIVVADNQLHDVYAEPVALLRTGLADRFVSTSIRPPALDLFGQGFLSLVLEENEKLPVIHLGDGANISSRREFLEFLEIMADAKRGWFLAPGNHDGYFFGNEHIDTESGQWHETTKHSGGPLTKAMAVRLYIAALVYSSAALRDDLGLESPRDGESVVEFAKRTEGAIPPNGRARISGGLLRAIAWSIDDERAPWRSWVVQWVDLSNPKMAAGAVLIDTSAYRSRPTLIPIPVNAGISGDVLDEQSAAATKWIESGPDQTWILMGHHPYDTLTDAGKSQFDSIRDAAKSRLYVSAHTHAGGPIVHALPDDDRNDDREDPDAWLELNVGSILDYPQAYTKLRLLHVEEPRANGATRRRTGYRSERVPILELLRDLGATPDWTTWLPGPLDADDALRYSRLNNLNAELAESILKDGLLALHARLLRLFPTESAREWPPDPETAQPLTSDALILERIETLGGEEEPLGPKIEFLRSLRKFEKTRKLEQLPGAPDPDLERRAFRLHTAYRAGWDEFNEDRRPFPGDSTVIFPRSR